MKLLAGDLTKNSLRLLWSGLGFFHVRVLGCQRWSFFHVLQSGLKTGQRVACAHLDFPPTQPPAPWTEMRKLFLMLLGSFSALGFWKVRSLHAQWTHSFPLSWTRRQVFAFTLPSDRNLWANPEHSVMLLSATLSGGCVSRNIRSICKQPWKIWSSISNGVTEPA